ncbi:hypothetical protein OUY24_02655 [Nonomuraea ferruginea]|uniref:Uncharacterized protein n=1 Tax=Nonomuraea ferruginea TaxID=46174 RepID=A0ABT4SQH2_9ACTN|nr:hypothetical protein [Nonomuraea ferruginea]MDA0639516.1 hypothetical protein [Nonomuraea ferruginea]
MLVKKPAQVSSVLRRRAGDRSCRSPGAGPAGASGSGIDRSGGCRIAASSALSLSRAPGERRVSRKSSDSGSLRSTAATSSAVATPPKANTERHPDAFCSTTAMTPPTVPPTA